METTINSSYFDKKTIQTNNKQKIVKLLSNKNTPKKMIVKYTDKQLREEVKKILI